MKNRIYLNNEWRFCENFEPEMIEAGYDDSSMQEVRIPHTCKEIPYHYFDEHIYQMVSGYRRRIEAPLEWKGKCVLLTSKGGMCGTYVKTIGKAGKAALIIKNAQAQDVRIEFEVEI